MWWRLTLAYYPRVRTSIAEVLATAGPVVRSGSVLVVVGQWASHPAASATQRLRYRRSRVGETRHRPARTQHALDLHCTQPSPKNCYKPKEGEGTMSPTLPRTSTIYNDDVSSGPRPKAHWYMLTHRAAARHVPRTGFSNGASTLKQHFVLPKNGSKYYLKYTFLVFPVLGIFGLGTSLAAATRLPTGPRIALHRVPVPPLHHYCP